MAQQTAVDFIIENLPQIDWDDPFYVGLLQEAKAMEKEQIEKAYIEGAEIAKEVLKEELKEVFVLPKDYIKWITCQTKS